MIAKRSQRRLPNGIGAFGQIKATANRYTSQRNVRWPPRVLPDMTQPHKSSRKECGGCDCSFHRIANASDRLRSCKQSLEQHADAIRTVARVLRVTPKFSGIIRIPVFGSLIPANVVASFLTQKILMSFDLSSLFRTASECVVHFVLLLRLGRLSPPRSEVS